MQPLICATDAWLVSALSLGTLAFGALLAWLVSGWRSDRQTARIERRHGARLAEVEGELVHARTRERELAEAMQGMERGNDAELHRARAMGENAMRAIGIRLAEAEVARSSAESRLTELMALESRHQVLLDGRAADRERMQQLGRVESELAECRSEVALLRERRREAQQLEATLRLQWAASEAALRAATSLHRERGATEEAARGRLQSRLAELEPLSIRVPQLEAEVRRLRAPSARPNIRPAGEAPQAVAPARPSRRRVPPPDDLRLIPGIGPVIARLLRRVGVTRFRQIARWSDRDIERFAQALGSFPDRIRRDRWVEGAREEHIRKYGRDPLTGVRVRSGG